MRGIFIDDFGLAGIMVLDLFEEVLVVALDRGRDLNAFGLTGICHADVSFPATRPRFGFMYKLWSLRVRRSRGRLA